MTADKPNRPPTSRRVLIFFNFLGTRMHFFFFLITICVAKTLFCLSIKLLGEQHLIWSPKGEPSIRRAMPLPGQGCHVPLGGSKGASSLIPGSYTSRWPSVVVTIILGISSAQPQYFSASCSVAWGFSPATQLSVPGARAPKCHEMFKPTWCREQREMDPWLFTSWYFQRLLQTLCKQRVSLTSAKGKAKQ